MSSITKPVSFQPPRWLRNTHIQTIGSSLFARKPALTKSVRRLLVTDEQVKLEAFIHDTKATNTNKTQQVILLHGWLGSADSSYVRSAAAHLLAAGYKVVRLNFRDHGDTAHLNEEMFHSARIKEVVDACIQLADCPSALIGFSLGGNFALRVCAQTAMPALAICPAIDPARSCSAIDSGPSVYRNYFLRKWYRALATKSAAFPALYDFSQVQNITNVLELTDRFIGSHLPYPSSQDYFDSYRIRGEMIAGKPAKIIASKDDPVIPWQSIAELETSAQVVLTEFGGHCGYVPSKWLNDQMLGFLAENNE